MKFIVFLSGLLLHFLLLHCTESVEGQKVNLTTLAQIIDFFDQNYMEKTAKGDPKPFAVAINVPRNQCEGNFDHSNFLIHVSATRVKNEIYNKASKFYNNEDLIAAGGLKPTCKDSQKQINLSKSEPVNYLLQENASFSKLLKHRNDSCVVIYTVYSPCKNMSGSYKIIPALETLKKHGGIKAFVFKKVYGLDENDHKCSDLALNCTEILDYVPLYRFVNKAVIPI